MTSRPVIYVDTSALAAVLIDQPESPALADWLDQTSALLVSSAVYLIFAVGLSLTLPSGLLGGW